jgi:hypothetical protein
VRRSATVCCCCYCCCCCCCCCDTNRSLCPMPGWVDGLQHKVCLHGSTAFALPLHMLEFIERPRLVAQHASTTRHNVTALGRHMYGVCRSTLGDSCCLPWSVHRNAPLTSLSMPSHHGRRM